MRTEVGEGVGECGVHLAKSEAADAGSYNRFAFPGIIGTACQQASGRLGPDCDENWIGIEAVASFSGLHWT